jgi:hypothetical protein
MTIQVGICCADRSIVLASDTKVRTSERVVAEKEPPESIVHRSKIAFGSRGIAAAMAGDGPVGTDWAKEFVADASALPGMPDNLPAYLCAWGNERFRKFNSYCSLLIVDPLNKYCPLWKLRIGPHSSDDSSSKSMVNGNEINPASIFWLEYMKADKKPSLQAATAIAIATLGMAEELNPYGVGGLELHWHKDGEWQHLSPEETDHAQSRFGKTQARIKRLVLGLGIRPVTPPQP